MWLFNRQAAKQQLRMSDNKVLEALILFNKECSTNHPFNVKDFIEPNPKLAGHKHYPIDIHVALVVEVKSKREYKPMGSLRNIIVAFVDEKGSINFASVDSRFFIPYEKPYIATLLKTFRDELSEIREGDIVTFAKGYNETYQEGVKSFHKGKKIRTHMIVAHVDEDQKVYLRVMLDDEDHTIVDTCFESWKLRKFNDTLEELTRYNIELEKEQTANAKEVEMPSPWSLI